VLVLPGLAWQAWFPRAQGSDDPRPDSIRPDPAQRLADAVGLSTALTALAALGTFVFGVQLAGWMVAGIYVLLAGLAAAGWARRLTRRRSGSRQNGRPGKVSLPALLPLLITLSLLLIITAWRLSQAASLVLPAWVDSVHHVLIVRVFLEQGALPASLQPYIPVPFYYHFGFHAVGAVFSFLTRLEPDQAVLILGQVINAAICLSVYRLGRSFWKDPLRPLGAALLVAFFAHMPAYYLTWGRYTLLAGLLLMPVAMAQAVEMRNGPVRKEAVLRLAVLTGGLLLTHYLAAILLALFLGVLAAEQGILLLRKKIQIRRSNGLEAGRLQGGTGELRPVWMAWVAGGGLGLLLALPWLWRIWHFNSLSFQVNLVDSPDQVYFQDYINYLWYLSGPKRNYLLIALGALGGLLALVSNPGGTAIVPPRKHLPSFHWPPHWFSRSTGSSHDLDAPPTHPETRPGAGLSADPVEVAFSPVPAGILEPGPYQASSPGPAERTVPVVEGSASAVPLPTRPEAPSYPAAPAGAATVTRANRPTGGLGPLLAWTLLVVLLTVPYGVALGPFRPDHMAIVWFLPFSLFASHLLVSACQALWKVSRGGQSRGERGSGGWSHPSQAGLPVLGLAGTALVWGLLLFWGGRDTLSIVNPSTLLVDAADRAALEWIEANTPADSHFWINVVGWQGPIYRGVDGGWWIQPITGRSTALPAVLYSTGTSEYLAQITGWAEQASQVKGCSAELYASLRSSGSTHIYLHAGRGSLQPAALEGCIGLERVYESEGVAIYEVDLSVVGP